ncbi:uncharacterized protein LOC116204216 [Punica granatum]|uniref:Uncharacterized protein LOC116204216 n=1 Tax=Punica granatum TaxID=22663 RepID=A0A6P8DCD2_PUNGR|nr:uncharacterized protein LOC116204216 [Punica granatum]
MGLSYQVPPPLNNLPPEPGTPTQAAPPAPLINFLPKTETEQERRMKKMEETIRALQAGNSHSITAYAHPVHYTQLYPTQQAYSPAIPTVIQSPPPQQYAPAQAQQGRSPTSRSPQPALRAPAPRTQLGNAAQSRPRKQYTTLPALPSHIFRQLLAGNKIKTEALGPNFDPTVQNQNLSCEFHKHAPGHTLDNCWRLQDRIQEMIDTRQISFNEVKPPNVLTNPLPDHGSSSGPSINMISIAAIGEEKDAQRTSVPFIVNYTSTDGAFTSTPFVVEVPTKESYQDCRVPWDYGSEVANMEQEMSAMGITRSGHVYQGPKLADKGKAPVTSFSAIPEAAPLPSKKVTEQEAEAFMKVIKASEFKVVEQMGKSPGHISLLALLLSSEPHRDALPKVLTAAQVSKETAPNRIEETVNSIFSNQISFVEDELPSEGQGHLRALHIVCKCNNHVDGRVMIDNSSTLNVCPISTLKQMKVDTSRIRASKTIVRAFDGSKRIVNGKINLLIDVGPCSFSVTFQILEIPNAFSMLLGRTWIHVVGAVPSSLHQKLKFFIEVDPSLADRMIGKVLLKNDYVPGTGLGAHAQGILRPIKMEEYRNRRGLDFRPSCHEIMQARRGKHLHHLAAHYGKLSRGILVPLLSQFFPAPP